MQSDFFDKKIKEAAENHHPSYDENAWNKMEQLLDKHMPQEKERKRRFIFFLLFFLFLGGGLFIVIGKRSSSNKPLANTNIEKKPDQINKDVSNKVNEAASNKNNPTFEEKTSTDNVFIKNDNSVVTNKNGAQGINNTATYQDRNADQSLTRITQKSSYTNAKGKKHAVVDNKTDDQVFKNDQQNTVSDTQAKASDNTSLNTTNNNDINTTSSSKQNNIIQKTEDNQVTISKTDNTITKNTDSTKKEEASNKTSVAKKNTGKNKKESKFSLSVSAGPDFSKAGSSSLGRATFAYGVGVNYQLKKFTLRSGFYVASKIYSAGPDDYQLDYNLPSNIKLLNVDANCKVYEIPLSLTYNFSNRKNSNWYAGLGLSSYLMKNEKYTNLYKNINSGSTYSRNFEYTSQNKNLFSVLNISAGYTRRLNNTFSISAEPYLKIPLSGVGEGKVHLNSAGVLFSVGIKPFHSGKKQK